MLIINQDGLEAYNLDFARNIYVTPHGEIKLTTDFSRGGLIGKYRNEEEAGRAFKVIMTGIHDGRGVVKAPAQGQVGAPMTKGRHHFADGSVQKGHGGS